MIPERPMVARRDVLTGMAAAGAGALLPQAAFARARTDRRLVVVILRGGVDGLSLLPPVDEQAYYDLRPRIAIDKPGSGHNAAVALGGGFGLHPALAPLAPLYRTGELLPVTALGIPLHTRSHFDAQDVLENGTPQPHGRHDGWLNRAIVALDGGRGGLGLSVGHGMPLMIRGAAPVRSWEPKVLPQADPGFLDQLAMLYAKDPMFARALRQARRSAASEPAGMGGAARRMRGGKAARVLARATGKLLRQPDGPRIAVIEAGGWDTHVNEKGVLNRLLPHLANGLVTLKEALGPAWGKSAVVVVTEFGRTVAENGGRGTDHGTGSIALLLGGAVRGGRIAGRWPGLSERALYEGRDLRPTTDMRSMLKGVLHDHLRIGEARLEDTVFPESRAARPMGGLIRDG
jgi:uncharacterized protein (DUF1501 family)